MVVLSWFDATTQTVRFAEWSGMGSGPVLLAIDAAKKLIPDFNPIDIAIDLNKHPFTQSTYASGNPLLAGFEEISQGIVDHRIVDLGVNIGGLQSVYLCPLKSEGQVIGSLSFLLAEEPSETTQRICDAFSQQASLTAENIQLLERERNEVAELQELDELKSEFLSMVSHQLKTPITSIKASVELFREIQEFQPNTPQSRLVDSMGRGIVSLEALVNNLLEFARLKSARVHLETEMANVGELVRSAVALVTPSAEMKDQAIHVDIEDKKLKVQLDKHRISQVVLNLLNNANLYTPRGGHITVQVKSEGDQLAVSVKDTCGGIPKNELPRIFQAYYRPMPKSKATVKASGSGLGLAIAKSLVELHCGKIWAESTEGAGCTFTFHLPKG
jgi:signal transduction histidine kinase